MKELFVTYEHAVLLKALGFGEPCFGYYNSTQSNQNELLFPKYAGELKNWNKEPHLSSSPLKPQVFKWFRENHNILANVYSNASGFLFEWHDAKGGTHRYDSGFDGPNDGGCWDTYEEAETACIDKIIELIRTKVNSSSLREAYLSDTILNS